MGRGRSFIARASSLRSHRFRGAIFAVRAVGCSPHDPGCSFGSWPWHSFAVAATISLYLCFVLVVLRNGPAHPIHSAREPAPHAAILVARSAGNPHRFSGPSPASSRSRPGLAPVIGPWRKLWLGPSTWVGETHGAVFAKLVARECC